MATASATRESADRYVGERRNQLRHGYGVYHYKNGFFRYEGQWRNGLKQGHGKLILGDGGYYEGTFSDGEIEGHGFRQFGLTGSTYSGQFVQGEMHGQGLCKEADGSQYEGSWFRNKREGNGILTEADSSTYEGEFHEHKRHGQGVQTYSNGDQYDGDWVSGMRHGQGMLRCQDSTIYDGQWKGGQYHGEGSILHASGVTYVGLWKEGRPINEAVQIKAVCDVMRVEQGKPFTLALKCVNHEGEVVETDNGRSFRVTAAIHLSLAKKHCSKPSVAELLREGVAVTALDGTQGLNYELLQVPTELGSTLGMPVESAVNLEHEAGEKVIPTKDQNEDLLVPANPLHSSSLSPSHVAKVQQAQTDSTASLAGDHTRSLYAINRAHSEVLSAEAQFLATLVPVSAVQSKEGVIEFQDLFIPPPPAPKLSLAPMSDDQAQKLVTPSQDKGKRELHSSSTIRGQDSASTAANTLSVPTKGSSPLASPRHPKVDDLQAAQGSGLASSSVSSRKKSSISGTKPSKKSPSRKSRLIDKEKLLHGRREKFCLSGHYWLTVKEVTEPPFLGEHLPPVQIPITVVSAKGSSKLTPVEKVIREHAVVKKLKLSN